LLLKRDSEASPGSESTAAKVEVLTLGQELGLGLGLGLGLEFSASV